MNSLHYKNPLAPSQLVHHGNPRTIVQPKLTINAPGDEYEQEADAMADSVMRMSSNETVKPRTGLIGASLKRKVASEKAEVNQNNSAVNIHQTNNAVSVASDSLTSSLNATRAEGFPLPSETRNFMENAFSTDFSAVRVHNDKRSSEMNKEINSRAFTVGNDLYFNNGEYKPGNAEGKKLLAHELSHVVQQNDNLKSKKIQRVGPVVFLGIGAAEWIAIGATGYVVAGDAISSASGDVSYTFDEMEGVLLPAGGSDVPAYRTQNPTRTIYEATHQLAVFFGSKWDDREMGIKFGITFSYDGLAIGNISLNIIDVYDNSLWGGNVNVNITPRSLSSGMSSIRITVNMGTNNSWIIPDVVGSGIFTLRADSDLSNVSATTYFDYQIG